MGVCIYAIHQLNASSTEVYQPNNIIFTIRDQSDDGANKQIAMLSDIIKHLKENSEIPY